MTYSYQCDGGHQFEETYQIGHAPATTICTSCASRAKRDFHADFQGVTFDVVDPFRSYNLSTKKIRAEGEQQRILDAPCDNFERKILEKTYGRTYIGDDTSGMSKYARDGIAAYTEKKRSREVL